MLVKLRWSRIREKDGSGCNANVPWWTTKPKTSWNDLTVLLHVQDRVYVWVYYGDGGTAAATVATVITIPEYIAVFVASAFAVGCLTPRNSKL